MKTCIAFVIALIICPLSPMIAQEPTPKAPPGVPEGAKFFNGKWYRVYVEPAGWNVARKRCLALKGRLAIVPDEPTRVFIQQIATGRQLWLGATNERSKSGRWKWVDGTAMKFEAWDTGQPSGGNEHYLEVWGAKGFWNDGVENDTGVVGYICEWKPK